MHLRPSFTDSDYHHLHLSEIEKIDDQLVTSRVIVIGNVGTAVGVADALIDARKRAYMLAVKVIVPNARYRQDIGTKLLTHDFKQLINWGYIDLKQVTIYNPNID